MIPPAERGDDYAMTLGIDKFAVKAIQSRGVLIDLEKHFGRAEKTVTFNEFENVMRADGVFGRAGRHGLHPHGVRRRGAEDGPRAGSGAHPPHVQRH